MSTMLKQVKKALLDHNVHASSVSINKEGIITVRKAFFFRNGSAAGTFANRVMDALLNGAKLPVTMLDFGEHYAPFRGGASVSKQSNFWVSLEQVS